MKKLADPSQVPAYVHLFRRVCLTIPTPNLLRRRIFTACFHVFHAHDLHLCPQELLPENMEVVASHATAYGLLIHLLARLPVRPLSPPLAAAVANIANAANVNASFVVHRPSTLAIPRELLLRRPAAVALGHPLLAAQSRVLVLLVLLSCFAAAATAATAAVECWSYWWRGCCCR